MRDKPFTTPRTSWVHFFNVWLVKAGMQAVWPALCVR